MIGNKTLEDLLRPISESLGRAEVPSQVNRDKDAYPLPRRVTDGMDAAALTDLFASEAGKIRVTVHRCAAGEAPQVVAGIVAEEPGDVVLAGDNRLAALDLVPAVTQAAAGNAVTVWNPNDANAVASAEKARYGVTFAAAGIAETATVVQPASTLCGRSVSLLPLTHIAVVDAADIVGTMADYLRTVDKDALPSQICFISGPSATADIELVRVEGVHGPMYVHYVILEN
ncbi:Lactate utilization protein C [Slackia heliotrinireducens]|uniref:Uncharacterized conserved protein n=1 Tax=Slackia heliotrinireducens (strain ATCC 29202 / DSM 20476 / NCTC 11029 / RHS 1) TaxID=471855 RepID=C7N3M3_SLAHD|nr:lactate utilization protein C [Slackia heliotrinireducens]ACV21614.1 uncharacterized conserved protein [Slackia heliotrinireducens DSM 20476]VEG99170.1 Lactate utilization protein C [Slackia heliotrinireducens]